MQIDACIRGEPVVLVFEVDGENLILERIETTEGEWWHGYAGPDTLHELECLCWTHYDAWCKAENDDLAIMNFVNKSEGL